MNKSTIDPALSSYLMSRMYMESSVSVLGRYLWLLVGWNRLVVELLPPDQCAADPFVVSLTLAFLWIRAVSLLNQVPL